MRAVILARVSTKDKGQTAENQEHILNEHAKKHGWDVVEVISVEQSAWKDKSAHAIEEQVFQPFKEGRADVLMVWAMDRWTRRGPGAALRLIHTLENHFSGHFYSLQESFLSTASMDPSVRELMLSLMGWMAKQESSRKSERVKARVEHKKVQAAKLGQRAKWGKGKMLLEADRDRIQHLSNEGMSQRAIAAEVGTSVGSVNRVLNGQ